jgi:hypothetical protein
VNAWLGATVVVMAAVLVGFAMVCSGRIRRLDRLHVRTDAARAGLESALERRAAAALAVAVAVETGEVEDGANPAARAGRLRLAVAAARAARLSDADREAAENTLGRALAALDRSMLPPALLEELIDAEQLLVLARRVHIDAVRDTRMLRSRRMVRWLRLAGSAPMPEYFEIADPEFDVTELARSPSTTWPSLGGSRTGGSARPADVPSLRPSPRVIER